MQQGKASVGWLKSEWPDRYTYCTRQEARLSTYECKPARGAHQKQGFEPKKKERHNERGFDDGNMA
jgi:hypothetical protein